MEISQQVLAHSFSSLQLMALIHLRFFGFFFSFLFLEQELTIVCDCRVGMSSANNLDENLTCIWLGNHKKRDKNNHIDH